MLPVLGRETTRHSSLPFPHRMFVRALIQPVRTRNQAVLLHAFGRLCRIFRTWFGRVSLAAHPRSCQILRFPPKKARLPHHLCTLCGDYCAGRRKTRLSSQNEWAFTLHAATLLRHLHDTRNPGKSRRFRTENLISFQHEEKLKIARKPLAKRLDKQKLAIGKKPKGDGDSLLDHIAQHERKLMKNPKNPSASRKTGPGFNF